MRTSAVKLRHDSKPIYEMKLYVTGTNRRSQLAIANLNQICEQHLQEGYDLEVVDIYQFPNAATEAEILAAPTLIKQRPFPVRRLIGDLSQRERVLVLLDLKKR